MNTINFIKSSIAVSRSMTLGLIMDLKDKPLAQPTVNGGNHALWILGHLAHSESSLLNGMIQGKETCTLEHLKEQFAFQTQPSLDASTYPSIDSLLSDFETARTETLAFLETLTDADLDLPAPGCPEEWKEYFGTIGQCFTMISIHPTMHYGQLADIRKALGRELMMA